MDLSKIMSISGKNGLFKLISQGKNNFIVESLEDGKRVPAFSHDGIATLDNISIFTEDEDVSLTSVFEAIYKKENGNEVPPSISDNTSLKKYFQEVLPTYDKERVYVSNIKKVLSWYNILIKNNLIDIEEPQAEVQEETTDNENN
ncbi:MAG TPA: DUF5606 domain-containing protein [Bacteroidales bacterium]|nr:DUF5606 domain-containing protein [Bacteroidales bacterium]